MSSQAQVTKPTPKVVGNKQQVVFKPVETRKAESLPGVDEGRSYLLSTGWTEASRNEKGESFWSDPASAGPKTSTKQRAVQLPSRDGSDPTIVQQTVCPPAEWTYPYHEAITIQRQRDGATAKQAE